MVLINFGKNLVMLNFFLVVYMHQWRNSWFILKAVYTNCFSCLEIGIGSAQECRWGLCFNISKIETVLNWPVVRRFTVSTDWVLY